MLCRLPGVVKKGVFDDEHFVSGVDLMPTFFDLTGIKGPAKIDGRSFLSIIKGGKQDGRDYVFTQIDKKAGHDAVPMRCVQDGKYGYIYNPFSNGEHRYRNNNEGLTMKAMNEAAQTDPAIKKRVDLFRYRVPEELYDLEKDRDSLVNLIDNPEHKKTLKRLQKKLEDWMVETNDPMLEAFRNKDDRAKVDAVMVKTYGPRKVPKSRKNRKDKK
jgi:N-sulfoglucosamine sulfohydrolase